MTFPLPYSRLSRSTPFPPPLLERTLAAGDVEGVAPAVEVGTGVSAGTPVAGEAGVSEGAVWVSGLAPELVGSVVADFVPAIAAVA